MSVAAGDLDGDRQPDIAVVVEVGEYRPAGARIACRLRVRDRSEAAVAAVEQQDVGRWLRARRVVGSRPISEAANKQIHIAIRIDITPRCAVTQQVR